MVSCVCTAAALQKKPTSEGWGEGAAAGLAAIQHYGGAKPGDRTMLDALAPAIMTYQDKLSTGQQRTRTLAVLEVNL